MSEASSESDDSSRGSVTKSRKRSELPEDNRNGFAGGLDILAAVSLSAEYAGFAKNEMDTEDAHDNQEGAEDGADPISLDAKWNMNFNDLLAYGSSHGDYNAPRDYLTPDTKSSLGRWLETQRGRRRRGTLRADRLEKLQTLVDKGQLWWVELERPQHCLEWNTWFHELMTYREQFGTCNVPQLYKIPESGKALGKWLSVQRILYRKGQMKPHRAELIKALIDQGLLFAPKVKAAKNRENGVNLETYATESISSTSLEGSNL